MRDGTRRRLSASLTLATLLAVRPAIADDDPAALVARGVELRVEHRDAEALALFERAFVLAPSAKTRAQIGLADQALGRWVEAEAALVDALASNDEWVLARRATIEEAVATVRRHLGSLEATAEVPGAEIVVDGRKRGELPLARPLRLTTGRHVVEVRAPGYYTANRLVDVEPEAELREAFELARAPAAPVAEPPRQSSRVDAARAPTAQRVVGWSLVGAGVASAAFAGVSFAVRDGAIRAYNDDPACPGTAAPSQPGPCADRVDASRTWSAVGVVAAAGAALLVVGGVVVVLTSPRAARGRASALVCGGAGCGVRF